MSASLSIRPATPDDVPTILGFIRELATFEKLLHEVVATEDDLQQALFGDRPYAEVVIAELDGKPVGQALFFHNFSTFLGKPGIYLEDLYVTPEARSQGVGEALLRHVAQLAVERNCARYEWVVLDWNERAEAFYRRMGAEPQPQWRIQRVSGEALQTLAQT